MFWAETQQFKCQTKGFLLCNKKTNNLEKNLENPAGIWRT